MFVFRACERNEDNWRIGDCVIHSLSTNEFTLRTKRAMLQDARIKLIVFSRNLKTGLSDRISEFRRAALSQPNARISYPYHYPEVRQICDRTTVTARVCRTCTQFDNEARVAIVVVVVVAVEKEIANIMPIRENRMSE